MRKVRRGMSCMAALMAVALVGCEEPKAKECDPCVRDSECETGLACLDFVDQSTGRTVGVRCAKPNTNTKCTL